MSDASKELKCVILTLKRENVLVPSSTIAEIISVEEIEKIDNAPGWMLGRINWRGESIPLFSFEAAGGDDEVLTNRSTQVAVFYMLGAESSKDSPYMAMMVSGVPHTSMFTDKQILADESSDNHHAMIAQRVRVNGVSMGILDLDAMESMVLEANL